MNHRATADFWRHYERLPEHVRSLADKNFLLLKGDPHHPSLHFKRLKASLWSVRVGRGYRALGTEEGDTVVWFWIGSHADYDDLIR